MAKERCGVCSLRGGQPSSQAPCWVSAINIPAQSKVPNGSLTGGRRLQPPFCIRRALGEQRHWCKHGSEPNPKFHVSVDQKNGVQPPTWVGVRKQDQAQEAPKLSVTGGSAFKDIYP